VLVAVGASVAAAGAGMASAAKPGSTLFAKTTPGVYKWTVPNGVRRVTFDLFGPAGGDTYNAGAFVAAGGLGGEATATVDVSPGRVFEIVVGGKGGDGDYVFNQVGAAGSNGGGPGGTSGYGGGGGATDVRGGACAATSSCADLSTRFLVAGGGGGSSVYGDVGGYGGGVTGGDGAGTNPGGGGTQTSGGIGSCHTCGQANDGSFGQGGLAYQLGGGGGGGWFGGGGGGTPTTYGSGGGGSGYITPLALSSSFQSGVHSGDGSVVISKA